ncbi:YfhL family 4Fe-4S dicluster ferredoxin [Chloroflexota bacterium]
MAYKITDECISCSACKDECKNGAIQEGDTIYVIDPARCTECVGWFTRPRCVEACSVDAHQLDPDHQETKERLLEKWQKLHPGKAPEAVDGGILMSLK